MILSLYSWRKRKPKQSDLKYVKIRHQCAITKQINEKKKEKKKKKKKVILKIMEPKTGGRYKRSDNGEEVIIRALQQNIN